jgi:hypothetical protein
MKLAVELVRLLYRVGWLIVLLIRETWFWAGVVIRLGYRQQHGTAVLQLDYPPRSPVIQNSRKTA